MTTPPFPSPTTRVPPLCHPSTSRPSPTPRPFPRFSSSLPRQPSPPIIRGHARFLSPPPRHVAALLRICVPPPPPPRHVVSPPVTCPPCLICLPLLYCPFFAVFVCLCRLFLPPPSCSFPTACVCPCRLTPTLTSSPPRPASFFAYFVFSFFSFSTPTRRLLCASFLFSASFALPLFAFSVCLWVLWCCRQLCGLRSFALCCLFTRLCWSGRWWGNRAGTGGGWLWGGRSGQRGGWGVGRRWVGQKK